MPPFLRSLVTKVSKLSTEESADGRWRDVPTEVRYLPVLQGDGGGPLVCNVDGYYELSGMVSWVSVLPDCHHDEALKPMTLSFWIKST